MAESTSLQPTQLTGKIGPDLNRLNPHQDEIRTHLGRINEISLLSFQQKECHLCSGARITGKHVLGVTLCEELLTDEIFSTIFTILHVVNSPDVDTRAVVNRRELDGYNFLLLVTVSIFTQN